MADAMIDDETTLAAALERLERLDPQVIGAMRRAAGAPPLRRRAPGLEGLVAIIISQQVSVASARAIEGRVADAFRPLDAAALLAADDDRLRGCGLSAPKMRTLRALAAAIA
ncbi:MAG: DNA-3-methyladenine glycosylase 2 family protein, partial [Methylobacteriaceae bacterium]|nr:DNA-3-methyladenine glycosylase 2 family protein [Methylobacteriaceae bacterium]